MADDRSAYLAEAYNRGILPPEMKSAYEEAQKRGLLGGAQPPTGRGGMMMPVPQPPERGPPPSGVMDALKSIPGGIARGIQSFGGLQQAGQQQFLGIQPEEIAPHQRPGAGMQPIVKSLPEAQTGPGKIVQSAVESAANPLSYLGAAGPARGVVSALGAGAGAEAAGQATGGNPLAIAAGGALGGLAGGTKGAPKQPEVSAATREEIRAARDAGYEGIAKSTRKIPTEEASLVAEDVRKALNEKTFFRGAEDANPTFHTVDRLTQGFDAGHITPGEVHSILKSLAYHERMYPGQAKAMAAGTAKDKIVEWLEKSYPEMAEPLAVANANHRVLKQLERLDVAAEKGELGARSTITGDNIDPAIRTQLKQLYFNKKIPKTAEEKAVLKSMIEGDTVTNIAKNFKKVKGTTRLLATALMHAKGAGVITHAGEILAKSISNRAMGRQVEKLDELIRGAAPASPKRLPKEESTRGRQRAIQAARGAATPLYEQ